jgi:hypothetical protein
MEQKIRKNEQSPLVASLGTLAAHIRPDKGGQLDFWYFLHNTADRDGKVSYRSLHQHSFTCTF